MLADRFLAVYAILLSVYMRATGRKLFVEFGCRIHPMASIKPGSGEIRIGKGTFIHPYVMLMAYKGKIYIGKNVTINPFSIIYGHGGVTIGDDVRIASHVVVIPAEHIYKDTERPIYTQGETKKGISIGHDVWIGTGARILDGSVIQKGCVIGANAILKCQTERDGVYVGTPARLIKSRRDGETAD